MISLPIPAQVSPKTYGDLLDKEGDVGRLVASLTKGNIKPETPAHIDPDILKTSLHRRPGWLAAFGQGGAAQSHLARHNVGLGYIFLFFGWFRQVEGNNWSGWHYKRGAPSLHVLFGWMQIAEILNVGNNGDVFLKRYPWLVDHPHLNVKGYFKNTVYVASNALELPCCNVGGVSGAGTFDVIRTKLVLTKAKQRNRPVWYLPNLFLIIKIYPNGSEIPME